MNTKKYPEGIFNDDFELCIKFVSEYSDVDRETTIDYFWDEVVAFYELKRKLDNVNQCDD